MPKWASRDYVDVQLLFFLRVLVSLLVKGRWYSYDCSVWNYHLRSKTVQKSSIGEDNPCLTVHAFIWVN